MEQAAASRTPFLGALPVTSKSKPSGLGAESERIACRTIEGSIEREEQLSMFEGLEDKVADKADTCLKRYLPESAYSYVEAFNNAPWKVGPDMTFDRSRSAALNILLFVFLILWSVETQFLDDDGRTDVIENLYVRSNQYIIDGNDIQKTRKIVFVLCKASFFQSQDLAVHV